LGHEAGDIMLKLVADRLVTAVRQEDTVARFGGDEFVLVLWELSDVDGVPILVSKVLMALSQPYFINGQTIHLSASAGVSIYPIHSEDLETLIKKADVALYESKQIRKNGFRIAMLDDKLH
jgi:two-component system cell cycle response regulator